MVNGQEQRMAVAIYWRMVTLKLMKGNVLFHWKTTARSSNNEHRTTFFVGFEAILFGLTGEKPPVETIVHVARELLLSLRLSYVVLLLCDGPITALTIRRSKAGDPDTAIHINGILIRFSSAYWRRIFKKKVIDHVFSRRDIVIPVVVRGTSALGCDQLGIPSWYCAIADNNSC